MQIDIWVDRFLLTMQFNDFLLLNTPATRIHSVCEGGMKNVNLRLHAIPLDPAIAWCSFVRACYPIDLIICVPDGIGGHLVVGGGF